MALPWPFGWLYCPQCSHDHWGRVSPYSPTDPATGKPIETCKTCRQKPPRRRKRPGDQPTLFGSD